MIVTTNPSLAGRRIVEYRGIVAGEAIIGTNLLRDLLARIIDLAGGRAGACEASLARARQTAPAGLEHRARAAGAQAAVGVDLDRVVLRSMPMVSANGTAVRLG